MYLRLRVLFLFLYVLVCLVRPLVGVATTQFRSMQRKSIIEILLLFADIY